jgi:hypothetical protein
VSFKKENTGCVSYFQWMECNKRSPYLVPIVRTVQPQTACLKVVPIGDWGTGGFEQIILVNYIIRRKGSTNLGPFNRKSGHIYLW